jgi:hypothetical protein
MDKLKFMIKKITGHELYVAHGVVSKISTEEYEMVSRVVEFDKNRGFRLPSVRDKKISELKTELNIAQIHITDLKGEIEILRVELDKKKDIPSRVFNNGDKLI